MQLHIKKTNMKKAEIKNDFPDFVKINMEIHNKKLKQVMADDEIEEKDFIDKIHSSIKGKQKK